MACVVWMSSLQARPWAKGSSGSLTGDLLRSLIQSGLSRSTIFTLSLLHLPSSGILLAKNMTCGLGNTLNLVSYLVDTKLPSFRASAMLYRWSEWSAAALLTSKMAILYSFSQRYFMSHSLPSSFIPAWAKMRCSARRDFPRPPLLSCTQMMVLSSGASSRSSKTRCCQAYG